jgi:hypothetical protein
LFDIFGVTAGELGGFEELADQINAHVTTGEEGKLAAVRAGVGRMAGKNPVNYSLVLLRRGNPTHPPKVGLANHISSPGVPTIVVDLCFSQARGTLR